jgi:hypothetical protein
MLRTTQILKYARIPQTSVPDTVALGFALVTAVPDDAPEPVTGAAAKVENGTRTLESQFKLRNANGGTEAQTSCAVLGQAWGALQGVLKGAARIPIPNPRSKLAQSLLDTLFPRGLGFVRSTHRTVWFQSQIRLRRIQEKNLEAQLAQAAGDSSFLEAIRATHAAFAVALKITEADSVPVYKVPNLVQGMSTVRELMTQYAVQLIAWGQQNGGEHLDDALLALNPIEAVRDAMRSSSTSDSGTDPQESAQTESAEAEPATDSEDDTAPSDSSSETSKAKSSEEPAAAAS